VSLVAVDAVGRDFDFTNATEGEQELHEVLGRLFRSLFHNVPDGVGDRGLEHHALGLEASKVDAHDLTRFQRRFLTESFRCEQSNARRFSQLDGFGRVVWLLNRASFRLPDTGMRLALGYCPFWISASCGRLLGKSLRRAELSCTAFQSELSPATGSLLRHNTLPKRPVPRLVDLSLLTSMRINFLQIRFWTTLV
jgi:hypothetical protein